MELQHLQRLMGFALHPGAQIPDPSFWKSWFFPQSSVFFHVGAAEDVTGRARILKPGYICPGPGQQGAHSSPTLLFEAISLLMVKNCESRNHPFGNCCYMGTDLLWRQEDFDKSLIPKKIETKYLNNVTMFFLTFSKCHILIFRFQMSFL